MLRARGLFVGAALGLAWLALVRPLSATWPPTARAAAVAHGALTGAVADSNTAQPLSGASIVVGLVTRADSLRSLRTVAYGYCQFALGPRRGGIAPPSRVLAGARTDKEGRFLIRSLAPGSYRVVVRRLGYCPVERRVKILAGQVTELRIATVGAMPLE